jgi:NadR type nicotinamide-nucleotide adenylyltransferase
VNSGLRRVVLTGSESTGKSTLAAALARRYDAPWTPEAARLYVEARGGAPLGYDDVERIARAHVETADRAAAHARGVLVLDTDLVSTVVYSRYYFGACPDWVEREARERLADLYLLLHPDVPWQADPARDRPLGREEIHALFRDALDAFGARRVDIRGTFPEREARAAEAIGALLAEPSTG